MLVNSIRDLRAHIVLDRLPTQLSVKGWHNSPYRSTWSENGRDLYDVAVEAGI